MPVRGKRMCHRLPLENLGNAGLRHGGQESPLCVGHVEREEGQEVAVGEGMAEALRQ